MKRKNLDLANKNGEPTGIRKEAALNLFTDGEFFSLVNILYNRLGVSRPEHIVNIYQTRYALG